MLDTHELIARIFTLQYSRLNKPRGILLMAVAVTAKGFNLYPLGF
jgi:hypothetical protein